MSVWKQLEHDLTQWLQACATDLIIYRNPNQAIAGFPSDGFRSDGMLTDGRTLIAIEVEAGQMHPDTNVGKYWLLHQAYRPYERIILFHIYTPDFNSYGWRLQLGQFYAQKMQAEMPLDYRLLDYRTIPDEQYDALLAEIQRTITEVLQHELRQGGTDGINQ